MEGCFRPWMFEPATPAQMEFINNICSVTRVEFSSVKTKLDAKVYIDKHINMYYEMLAEKIKTDERNRKRRNYSKGNYPKPSCNFEDGYDIFDSSDFY